jgi:hypothetical protein
MLVGEKKTRYGASPQTPPVAGVAGVQGVRSSPYTLPSGYLFVRSVKGKGFAPSSLPRPAFLGLVQLWAAFDSSLDASRQAYLRNSWIYQNIYSVSVSHKKIETVTIS